MFLNCHFFVITGCIAFASELPLSFPFKEYHQSNVINRDYYMVTFISSVISSRGKWYQPLAFGLRLIPLFKG